MRFFHNDDLGKLLLRLCVGLLVLLHGLNKLADPTILNGIANQLVHMGLPSFVAYGVLIGEIVGPLMTIIGYQARIGALLIAINMVVALALMHLSQLWTLNAQGGWTLELQGMFLFGALAVLFLGSGRMAARPD
ncbi:DoxX family protein [Salinicola rhizosphaerae]|uniref:GntR family transcriptional regulator n=1 Tax=Salinicola rhizosphaerae TaxID=1443141 RepID=A0ABQ3E321_9GAMM|nr:DoxX family protein [Salinicola rhizosphaerae]GHB22135.1 GntR family transcriptional regulator [Salinicola rhizosphaerae]